MHKSSRDSSKRKGIILNKAIMMEHDKHVTFRSAASSVHGDPPSPEAAFHAGTAVDTPCSDSTGYFTIPNLSKSFDDCASDEKIDFSPHEVATCDSCRKDCQTLNSFRGNIATHGCLNCSKTFCAGHLSKHRLHHKSHHILAILEFQDWQSDRGKTDHMAEYDSMEEAGVTWCSKHVNEPVKGYCKTCSAVVCHVCTLLHFPEEHEIISIKAAMRDAKHSITEDLDLLEQTSVVAESNAQVVQGEVEAALKQEEKLAAEITAWFSALRRAAKERERQLLAELQNNTAARVEAFKSAASDLRKIGRIMRREAKETAEVALNVAGGVEMVALAAGFRKETQIILGNGSTLISASKQLRDEGILRFAVAGDIDLPEAVAKAGDLESGVDVKSPLDAHGHAHAETLKKSPSRRTSISSQASIPLASAVFVESHNSRAPSTPTIESAPKYATEVATGASGATVWITDPKTGRDREFFVRADKSVVAVPGVRRS